MGLFNRKKGPVKFSSKWFSTVSDTEFYDAREPVRQAYCRGERGAEALLNLFNNEEIKRLNAKYEKEHPNAQPRHREHGWYLPNDD